MRYGTIMVHLDLVHSNDARLSIATDLAAKCDARLVGIAACDPMPSHYGRGAVASSFIDQDRKIILKQIAQCEERFKTVAQARVEKFEWRAALAKPTPFIAREARCADLVIVGTNRDEIINDPLRRLDCADLDAGRATSPSCSARSRSHRSQVGAGGLARHA